MKKIILLFALFLTCQNLRAQPCTESALNNSGFIILAAEQIQQSFTAGCSGFIGSISFVLEATAQTPINTPLSVELRALGGGLCAPGAVIATSNSTPIAGGGLSTNTYTFATPPAVTMGTQYVLAFVGGGSTLGVQGFIGASDQYAGGNSSNVNAGGCAVNSFDWEFAVNIIGTPAPVQLTSFTAKAVNNKFVQLHWETVSELNNAFFTIEKSKNGSDWETVSTTAGAEHSNTLLKYDTKDAHPFNGFSYYRLKQTDIDGTSTLSKIEIVSFLSNGNLLISPNPTTDRVLISGNLIGKKLELLDASGKTITASAKIRSNNSSTEIDLSTLAKGIYILKIDNTAHKIIKQ